MLVLSEVRLSNFMPFRGEYAIAFNPRQVVGVLGTYTEQEGKSNRAGKTSFVEAIVWCLYGESRAAKEIELVHEGTTEMRVEVELLDTATKHRTQIIRWRDNKNKGGLDLVGWEGKRKAAAQAQIDDFLGMNYQEFLQTAFFKQGDIDQFMNAGPQERKAMLMRWVQVTDWAKYEEYAKTYQSILQKERDKVAGALAAGTGVVMSRGEMVALADQYKIELEELVAEAKGISSELITLGVLEDKLRECSGKVQDMRLIQDKQNELRLQRPDGRAHAKAVLELEGKLASIPLISEERADEIRGKLENAQRVQTESSLGMNQLTKELSTLREKMTGLCPLIKESCDRIALTPEMKSEREDRIADMAAKRDRARTIIDKAQALLAEYRDQRRWQAEYDRLIERSNTAAAIEDQIAGLEQRRVALLDQVPVNYREQHGEVIDKIKATRQAASEVNARLAEIHALKGELVTRYNTGIEILRHREALTEHAEVLDAALADAFYAAYMFGKNGIPSIELENSFGIIEAEANNVLAKLKAPFTLEFQATRPLQDWEANCLACGTPYPRGTRDHFCAKCSTARDKKVRDELSVRVLEGAREKQFYMDSGGGKLLLSTAIRIAKSRLAQINKGSAWGVLFMDEVFGALDSVNRKSMVALITNTLVKELGFRQIFIISHEPEIRDAIPDVLQVTRQPGDYSELAWQ